MIQGARGDGIVHAVTVIMPDRVQGGGESLLGLIPLQEDEAEKMEAAIRFRVLGDGFAGSLLCGGELLLGEQSLTKEKPRKAVVRRLGEDLPGGILQGHMPAVFQQVGQTQMGGRRRHLGKPTTLSGGWASFLSHDFREGI